VPLKRTLAERLLAGDRAAAAELALGLLKPRRDNLVERPWGGNKLRAFKGLDSAAGAPGRRFGESFELAADDADDEARLHPSMIDLPDGSTIALPALLAVHAEALLGVGFVRRYGRRFPLLPKLLDVAELLSVQAHPRGNTEVYVIVDAEPGATIRLGFAADVDAAAFRERLLKGRRDQQRLLELVGAADSGAALQGLLAPWLARRGTAAAELWPALERRLPAGVRRSEVEKLLTALHEVYWAVLDALNAIPVKAGDVIYNANPPRVTAQTRAPASAEVHALGNPEGLSVLVLEIRRPGPTLRAWDNVRFPLRNIDVSAALDSLNLRATSPVDFVVEPKLVRPGVRRSVDREYFRVEHVEPSGGLAVAVPASPPHSLHVLSGSVRLERADGRALGTLERGESALVPAGVGAYCVSARGPRALLIKVDLPPYAD
jgi:mannose-6-phosphate isomerase class I